MSFKQLSLSELPKELLRLKNPPKALFYEGDTKLLAMPKISVVGSRKASTYTKECVSRLCAALNRAGVCVVSGGAIGVDIIAHKAAMSATIGVFGNGLDILYPSSNAKLIREIYEKGLALSEYEAGVGVGHRGVHFLERNRIVVALSQALVVAQADERSGSMQSARLALDLGVPLFVLPQRCGESDGTNRLLSEGKARLIHDFNEFAALFGDKNFTKSNAKESFKDEIIKFCENGVSLDEALAKFGDKIYEYELCGALEIVNLRVKSVG